MSLAVTASLNSNQLVYKICGVPFSAAMANLASATVYWPRLTKKETGLFLKTNVVTETKKFRHLSLRVGWTTSVDINGMILLFERTTELDHYSEGKVTVIKSPTPFLMFSLEIWTVRPSERDHVLAWWTDSVWLFGTLLVCCSCCLILDWVDVFMTVLATKLHSFYMAGLLCSRVCTWDTCSCNLETVTKLLILFQRWSFFWGGNCDLPPTYISSNSFSRANLFCWVPAKRDSCGENWVRISGGSELSSDVSELYHNIPHFSE